MPSNLETALRPAALLLGIAQALNAPRLYCGQTTAAGSVRTRRPVNQQFGAAYAAVAKRPSNQLDAAHAIVAKRPINQLDAVRSDVARQPAS